MNNCEKKNLLTFEKIFELEQFYIFHSYKIPNSEKTILKLLNRKNVQSVLENKKKLENVELHITNADKRKLKFLFILQILT